MSNCKTCGGATIEVNGVTVHEGGGKDFQTCKACQWKGSQAMGFSECPRCGDKTSLEVQHSAN